MSAESHRERWSEAGNIRRHMSYPSLSPRQTHLLRHGTDEQSDVELLNSYRWGDLELPDGYESLHPNLHRLIARDSEWPRRREVSALTTSYAPVVRHWALEEGPYFRPGVQSLEPPPPAVTSRVPQASVGRSYFVPSLRPLTPSWPTISDSDASPPPYDAFGPWGGNLPRTKWLSPALLISAYRQQRRVRSIGQALVQAFESDGNIKDRLKREFADQHAAFVAVCTIAWLCMAKEKRAGQLTSSALLRSQVYDLLHNVLHLDTVIFSRRTTPEYLLADGGPRVFLGNSLPTPGSEGVRRHYHNAVGNNSDVIQWLHRNLQSGQLPVPHSRRWQSVLLSTIAHVATDHHDRPRLRAKFDLDIGALSTLPSCGLRKESLPGFIAWTTDGTHVRAAYCSSYALEIWPTVAEGCFNLISNAARQGAAKMVIRSQECSVTVNIQVGSNKTIKVDTFGASHMIFDVFSLFAWFGAICYMESSAQGVLRRPEISSSDAHDLSVKYRSTALQSIANPSDSSCWHGLARNFVIADDFVVTKRDNAEPGVEMPLDVMLTLGAIDNIAMLNGVPQLKGYSTRFTIESCNGKSIVWHFAAAPAGKRIPVSVDDGPPPGISFPSEDTLTELRKYRHFVGWLSSARCDVVGPPIATPQLDCNPEDDYVDADTICDPPEDQRHAITVLQGACLPQIRSIAHLVQPLTGNDSDRFGFVAPRLGDILEQASNESFLMFDTARTARKGYLLNGVDALAYMSFRRLKGSNFRQTLSETALIELHDFLTSASQLPVINTAAYLASHESTVIDTGGCTFGALLREMWEVLAHLSYVQQQPPSQSQSQIEAPFVLEGWPIGSILRRKAMVLPRLTALSPSSAGWLMLIRHMSIPTLLGEGLGDIIVSDSSQQCQLCKRMPRGQDFVTVRLVDLRRIHQMERREAGFDACITSTCGWTRTDNAVFSDRTADCETCTSALLHEVVPFDSGTKRALVQVEQYAGGAVILGTATNDSRPGPEPSLSISCSESLGNSNSAERAVIGTEGCHTAPDRAFVTIDPPTSGQSMSIAQSTSIGRARPEQIPITRADDILTLPIPMGGDLEGTNHKLARNTTIVTVRHRIRSRIARFRHASTNLIWQQHVLSSFTARTPMSSVRDKR